MDYSSTFPIHNPKISSPIPADGIGCPQIFEAQYFTSAAPGNPQEKRITEADLPTLKRGIYRLYTHKNSTVPQGERSAPLGVRTRNHVASLLVKVKFMF
ncbi:hypothetical protein MFRU_005g01450 [Monilinia fructicola]|nr:hypothetical protein MFRU_005g01450 [Monilinia fructicola]